MTWSASLLAAVLASIPGTQAKWLLQYSLQKIQGGKVKAVLSYRCASIMLDALFSLGPGGYGNWDLTSKLGSAARCSSSANSEIWFLRM